MSQGGQLHYRRIEREKISALKKSKGNFDADMVLSTLAIEEVSWWRANIFSAFRHIKVPEIDLIIHTDASNKGWGISDDISPSGGLWNTEEKLQHINWLELKAIDIGLQAYTRESNFQHIRIMCDNTTAISYVNNMGGMQSVSCDSLSKKIWDLCYIEKILDFCSFHSG